MKSVESPSSGETRGANGRTPYARPTPDTLGFKEKLGYGLGDTASHFVWDMVGFWLLFFYTMSIKSLPLRLARSCWSPGSGIWGLTRSLALSPTGRTHGGGNSVPTSCLAPSPTRCSPF